VPAGWSGLALLSVFRWGTLVGGLVIIADLATLALKPRLGGGVEMGYALDVLDIVLNAILFSVAGATVARETGRVALGAATGLLAGFIDGMVVGAALSIAPPAGVPVGSPEQLWFDNLTSNMLQGTLLATISAWFGTMARQRTGS
jgi:hypothetical protein